MNKIIKIISLVLGLVGVVALVRIISKGDEAIKAGDNGVVELIAYVGYTVVFIAVAAVVLFVLYNLLTSGKSLMQTLRGVGIFAAIIAIAYFLSGGDATKYLSDGVVVSDSKSQWVGAGLMAFYILLAIAALSMLGGGFKKMLSKK